MKRAVVFGLARSGVGAARLLTAMGHEVVVTDRKKESELLEHRAQLPAGVRVVAGGHPAGLIKGDDLVVVSPGVPLETEPLKRAREEGIEVISELELAYRVLGDISVLAVTGTNGKSTTVTLLDLMLRYSGRRSLLAGNIGNALSEELAGRANGRFHLTDIDCVVTEVSSFQLEGITSFRPRVAAVLNISRDHMDRYDSLDDYREAKARIFMNQEADDFLVLNADDPETMGLLEAGPRSRVFHFSRQREAEGVWLKGDTLYFGRDPLARWDEIGIPGVHNLENAMAAATMALLEGCPLDAVADALREFPGLEHRLEFVREREGIAYVNDSKGTNVGAVMKSLESFDEPVVLIAGGRDKNGDFAALAEAARGRLRAAVLIGEAREKLRSHLAGVAPVSEADGMEEAVQLAASLAQNGDVVLLSPACASFDQFRDFEERGRRFKDAVRAL